MSERFGTSWLDHLRSRPLPSGVSSVLPFAVDRFDEAVHFAELLVSLPADHSNEPRANWYFGAHLTAILGIVDAAQNDLKRAGRSRSWFDSTPIAKEFYLTVDNPDPKKRDPLGFSRAYKELRNIHMHFPDRLVIAENRVLLQDLAQHQELNPPARWFLRLLKDPPPELKKILLTPEQRERINDSIKTKMLEDVVGQFLCTIQMTLEQTWNELMEAANTG